MVFEYRLQLSSRSLAAWMVRCRLMEASEYISNDDQPIDSRKKELHNSLPGERKQGKHAYCSCSSFQNLHYLHFESMSYACLAGLLVKITWTCRTCLTLRLRRFVCPKFLKEQQLDLSIPLCQSAPACDIFLTVMIGKGTIFPGSTVGYAIPCCSEQRMFKNWVREERLFQQ